jgi:hypothetical protein
MYYHSYVLFLQSLLLDDGNDNDVPVTAAAAITLFVNSVINLLQSFSASSNIKAV